MAFVLRAASLDDIDEITDVVCTAMPMDPQWDYRMPRRKEFPQDTWNCTRRDYANVLSDEEKEKHRMNVIIAPSNEDKEVKKIIAVAVWDLTVQHYSMDDGTLSQVPLTTLPQPWRQRSRLLATFSTL
jgi:hypothetical protein